MTTLGTPEISVRPRVLIADDSRIVRATLIKQIEGMFEFREALNGEEAWEMLLIDPNIRVVITDITMPRLDGYGLLKRIRSSKISRIREIPVVVVSGSDESEERERAKAAGATELITKGIGTAQLLSRLDILSRLVATQREFERGLEALVRDGTHMEAAELPSMDALRAPASELLAGAVKSRKNFVVLNVCVGLRQTNLDRAAALPADVVDAVGRLLQRTVRRTDLVAKTGGAEFTLATGSINFDAASCFARRVCKAIANASLVRNDGITLIASCGVVSLSDDVLDAENLSFDALVAIAHTRALLGLSRAVTGVVGRTEEEVLQRATHSQSSAPGASTAAATPAEPEKAPGPDLGTLIRWAKEGRQEDVLPHIGKLSAELKPLMDLVVQQVKQ